MQNFLYTGIYAFVILYRCQRSSWSPVSLKCGLIIEVCSWGPLMASSFSFLKDKPTGLRMLGHWDFTARVRRAVKNPDRKQNTYIILCHNWTKKGYLRLNSTSRSWEHKQEERQQTHDRRSANKKEEEDPFNSFQGHVYVWPWGYGEASV